MLSVVSIIINIISLGLLSAFQNLIKSHRAKNWPTCIGKLKYWNIQSNEIDNEFGKEIETQIQRFIYSYTIDQVEFENNRIGFGFPNALREKFGQKDFDEILKNAPALKVYYSPQNPSESTLCVGVKGFHLTEVFIRLFLFTIALVFIFQVLI